MSDAAENTGNDGARAGSPSTPPSVSFGKYELFATLGRGGMAEVYLSVARGPMGFSKLAVVKRLRKSLSEEPSFLSMFLDEARVAARLNHPNVVHTYEVGEHNEVYFIAMEYLEGQPLNKIIRESLKRKRPLEEGFCARVVADALNGLDHAHKLRGYDGKPLGLVHRDVSPHNIFVTYDGHTKLCDFGIAKAAFSTTETEVGVLKGKVSYMAPEQALGNPVDARADVFAMGIVLWELLSGERLMTGDSTASTLRRLVNGEIPRVSARRKIDDELDTIVARALEKDRDARFSSAGEMRDALEKVLLRVPYRQHDVGRFTVDTFLRVKEEAERQVEKHMAILEAREARRDVQPLTVETLRRLEKSGASGSGHLVRLHEGSGLVTASFVGTFPRGPLSDVPLQDPRQSSVVPWAIALVLLAVVAVSAVVVAVRAGPVPVAPAPSAEAPPTASVASGGAVDPLVSAAPPSLALSVPSAPIPPRNDTPPAPGSTELRAPSVLPAPRLAVTADHADAGAPTPTVVGYLTFDTYPWTTVTEGGRTLGTTPLNRVVLDPGPHTLHVDNDEHGIHETHVVVIKPGEVTRGRLELR